MRFSLKPVCALCLWISCQAASAAPTGLNTIPTTDIVPVHSWIGMTQNGNTNLLSGPMFYSKPNLLLMSQFGLTSRIEAGADTIMPANVNGTEVALNAKYLLQTEDELRPNAAIGVANLANRQAPLYYLTLSKTLNYAQQLRERFRAHHRRNRKLLGRRIHAGLMLGSGGTMQPFAGTDLQLNETTVFQADWINGTGNAVTFGLVYILPDQRTVLNPAFLYSNDTHRIDGFYLNISHQFNL